MGKKYVSLKHKRDETLFRFFEKELELLARIRRIQMFIEMVIGNEQYDPNGVAQKRKNMELGYFCPNT